MTIFRLKTNPATGDIAIYSVPSHASTDNTPLTDPYLDPSRLQFHSGVITPSTTPALTQTVTVTIPAQSAQTKFAEQFNLFAHGKGEPCMVEGGFNDPDAPSSFVAFNGTMPVKVTATGHAVWLYLGATNTHVVCGYFGITRDAISSFTVDVTASAYDYLASGPAPAGDPGLPRVQYVPGSHLQLGRGRIDTRRRYIRKVAAAGDFALAISPTLTIVGSGNTNAHPSGEVGSFVQNEIGWRWRYSCNGYVKQTTEAWNGAATNGGSANAEFVLVKK